MQDIEQQSQKRINTSTPCEFGIYSECLGEGNDDVPKLWQVLIHLSLSKCTNLHQCLQSPHQTGV